MGRPELQLKLVNAFTAVTFPAASAMGATADHPNCVQCVTVSRQTDVGRDEGVGECVGS